MLQYRAKKVNKIVQLEKTNIARNIEANNFFDNLTLSVSVGIIVYRDFYILDNCHIVVGFDEVSECIALKLNSIVYHKL